MILGSDVLITDGGSESLKERVTTVEFCEQTKSYWISTLDKVTKANKVRDLSEGLLVVDRESQEALFQVFDKINVDESKLRELLRSNKQLEPTLKKHYVSRILVRLRFTEEILLLILGEYINLKNFSR
jgi:uncharacterized protein YrzB (UPF0473 family)